MKVAIVGAGNAGYSHACKFVAEGHSVRLLKTSHSIHEDSFEELKRQGGIFYIDDTCNGQEGFAELELVTRNESEAISGADIIVILTQTLQHSDLSNRIAPLLEPGQLVIVSPGYLGSVYFRQKCNNKNVLFAEGESLPFDARIVAPGKVHILFQNVRNPISFMPAILCEKGFNIAQKLLDRFHRRQNIIESAFHNPNLIVHTVGTIMSAARVEYSNGEFWMYREAFTPSTWNVVHDLDQEKMSILAAFDLPEQSFSDSFQFRTYEDLDADSLTAFTNYAHHGSPKGPCEVNHRYIYEDVPMGLCLMSSIGRKFGIPTPICDSLINISGSLLGKDFWKAGRTLESLGLGSMSAEKIIEYVMK